jgi:predicted ATPase
MKLLKEAVDRTVQGEGGLVFVHGEAGIGKTRLLRELGAYAQSRGVQVLHGRCPGLFKMDGVPPYVIWKEVIKDYLETCTPEQLYRVIGYYPAEVAKLVPEISQKLRTMPPSFPISPEQEQNRLFEAVSEFMTNLSREAPLLVILDDLQWTDPSSLLLLHYVARGVQKTPLLLLGAYRTIDVDAKHPLTPILAELKRENLPHSVSLKRMFLDDTSELTRQILKQDDVPPEFCKMVYGKTKGNPFFIEEVIESLKEEEVIRREEGKWEFREISAIEFPESVKNLVKTRLGRLDEECQNVLTTASFIGNDFTLEAVGAVTGIEKSKLLKLVDTLFKTGLIKERVVRGEGICSFADILVRDVVYEEVSPLTRKELHGVIACALEKVYAKTIDEHLGELAYHFLESGEKDKALDYFLKAGERATKVYANSEVASYFESALGLLQEKEGEPREKGRVLERLGDTKRLVGEYDTCMKYWNEALLVGKELGEKETVARLHRKMANVLWSSTGDTEKARIHHDEALRILEKGPESVELASLYEDMARMYLRTEDVPTARSRAEKAVALAMKLGAQEIVASASCDLAEALSLGDIKKAAELYERALKSATDNNYMETAIRASSSLSTLFPSIEFGSWVNDKSFEMLEKAYQLAKKAGDTHWMSYTGALLADAYCNMGNLNDAVLIAEESVALSRKTRNIPNLSRSLNYLGFYYALAGEWDKGEQLLEEALSLAQEVKDTQLSMMVFVDYEQLYGLMQEKWLKAKQQCENLIGISERTGVKFLEYYGKARLATDCIELGELEEAKHLIDNVREFGLKTDNILLISGTDWLMASLFRAQKKWKESIALFEKALQEHETIGANRFLVWSFAWLLRDYARVYRERDQFGDREEAEKLLNQALEIFQKMGAKKEIEKTTRLIDGLQLAPQVQMEEKTVSPAGYICDDMQGNITASPRELKVSESLELEIEVTNLRKEGTILLTKIAEVIPEGFAVVNKPELSRVEGNCLNIRDKRLEPSKTEAVKLILTPKIQGTFRIKPKIVYSYEKGKERMCEPEPISITVKELGIKGWLKGER